MTVLQIILIIIIIPVTILNIRYLTSGKKAKYMAKAKYSKTIGMLSRNEDLLGGHDSYTAAKYVSDSGNNYLVCRSKKKDLGAVVAENAFYLLSPLSAYKCTLIADEDGKKYRSITCVISSEEGEYARIMISENPHSKKGIGKYMMEIASDFRDEVNGVQES